MRYWRKRGRGTRKIILNNGNLAIFSKRKRKCDKCKFCPCLFLLSLWTVKNPARTPFLTQDLWLKSRSFLPYLAPLAQINGAHPARPTDRGTDRRRQTGFRSTKCPVGIISAENNIARDIYYSLFFLLWSGKAGGVFVCFNYFFPALSGGREFENVNRVTKQYMYSPCLTYLG